MVSTMTCRFRPLTFLSIIATRPPFSVVFTLWLSMIAALGVGLSETGSSIHQTWEVCSFRSLLPPIQPLLHPNRLLCKHPLREPYFCVDYEIQRTASQIRRWWGSPLGRGPSAPAEGWQISTPIPSAPCPPAKARVSPGPRRRPSSPPRGSRCERGGPPSSPWAKYLIRSRVSCPCSKRPKADTTAQGASRRAFRERD